jgi:signal transduction histidine kinase
MRPRAEKKCQVTDVTEYLSPTAAATGTGLGLAIARWIAEQHNGHID